MFEFSIKNVSALTRGQRVYSPEYTVNNLSWKLAVERNTNDKLSLYLHSTPVSFNSVHCDSVIGGSIAPILPLINFTEC